MRWLAIHLPLLSMQSLAPGEKRRPLAVMVRQAGRQCILHANGGATKAGVVSGMGVAAARALCTDLRLLPRDQKREHTALEGVAIWAGHFTSQVSLDPPWGLVLELGGSMRLFGGVESLLPQLRSGLRGLGYSTCVCLAPTPAAAMLLARSGWQGVVSERRMLPETVAPIPLALLPVEPARVDRLGDAGLETLGDLMALPSAALGRRLGPVFVDYLERLLGQAPDPRPLFRPPERFSRSLELPAEVHSRAALRFPCRRLLLELAGFLSARQSGTQCLEWLLHDAQGRETRFRLGLLVPTRDPVYLQGMMQERLERVDLQAPVCGVGLLVDQIQPQSCRNQPLFGERDATGQADHLLERLRARLGEDAVCTIQSVPDHRPERAWRRCTPERAPVGATRQGGPGQARPLWLLPDPESLALSRGWPWRGGRLHLGPERERVESGWWDGRPVARDYFLAHGPDGERLWVYRELGGERRWFLHGFF